MNKKKLPSLFRQHNYLSWAIYGGMSLLLLLLQMAPRFFPAVFHARPAVLVPFVVCVAIFEGGRAGAVIGLLCGSLWGIFSSRLFGFDALLLMMIGLVCGLLVERLFRANLPAAMLLSCAAILLRSLAEWFFCHVIFAHEQLFSLLWRVYLPGALYTAVLTPLLFWLVRLLARIIRRKGK